MLAVLILVVALVTACALQALTSAPVHPATTYYTACIGADGHLYGLGEGPFPASPCLTGDSPIQATVIRDTGP